MKLIFSRKGFDSASGGAASPIIDGKPISLPIPASSKSMTSYESIGIGQLVETVTQGRIKQSNLCHLDPMFEQGRCAFGQTSAAQSHLKNNGVGIGDVFLFFGLFSKIDKTDRHHRIFGYLRVEELIHLGQSPKLDDQPQGFSIQHPHTIGTWNPNNHLYIGEGFVTTYASNRLRLSEPGKSVSIWRVPTWLKKTGLTYHARVSRWTGKDMLKVVDRGQEFIADIEGNEAAISWLNDTIDEI